MLLHMSESHFFLRLIFHHYVYTTFFSSIDRHLGYFHLLAIVTNAAMSIGV